MVAKVGPVQAKFNGNVTFPISTRRRATPSPAKARAAPSVSPRGSGRQTLDEGEITVLTYTAKADVGGKLAQLGSRLIDGTAKKMADEFFNNFSKQVAAPAPALDEVPETGLSAAPEACCRTSSSGRPLRS